MKYVHDGGLDSSDKSGPARDLWIEIVGWWAVDEEDRSGPARDLWIEIVLSPIFSSSSMRRVPQGTCGLKFSWKRGTEPDTPSGPARDLWIEIAKADRILLRQNRRVPQGTCGLKSLGLR